MLKKKVNTNSGGKKYTLEGIKKQRTHRSVINPWANYVKKIPFHQVWENFSTKKKRPVIPQLDLMKSSQTPIDPLLYFPTSGELQHWCTPHLHVVCNFFPVGEDLGKVLGAQDVPQSRLCQKTGCWVSVGDVRHSQGSVLDTVVDHAIHTNCHWILSEDLQHKGSNFTTVNHLFL